MLGPFPLERLALRLMDAIGRLPGLGPQVPNEARDPSGIAGTVGKDGLGPLSLPLGEHGPDGRVAAAAEPLPDRGDGRGCGTWSDLPGGAVGPVRV